MLERAAFDVLLLDINMPELSGTGMVERLRARSSDIPAIVFVTAHEEHALQAFEQKAVDYVLKPFSSERLGEALDAAVRRTTGERAARLMEALATFKAYAERPPARIACKARGRILFVDPATIIAVEASRNYVLLRQLAGACMLRESISTMEEKLQPYGFVRVHRSVLVNATFVHEIQPWPTGEYILHVKGVKELREYTVTRTYKKNIGQLASLWVGKEM
jgi:two-component system LytT family response regulator